MTEEQFRALLDCANHPERFDEIVNQLGDADAHNTQFVVSRANKKGRGLILKISGQAENVYFTFCTYANQDFRLGLRRRLLENNIISNDGIVFDGLKGLVVEDKKGTHNGKVCDFYPQTPIPPNEVWNNLQILRGMKEALLQKLNGVRAFDVEVPATVVAQGGNQEEQNLDNNRNGEDQNQGDNSMNNTKNKIVFGAPGTGKSHMLEVERKKEQDGERIFPDANFERVTFYSTYSYAQFVGSYKPVMKRDGNNEKIAYQFVPGPFLRMLVKAVSNPNQNYLLIIEEINRANAAAVFGDVFQLLDRTSKGESEYTIGASEDVIRYLNGVENGNPILSLQGKKFFGMVKKASDDIADDNLDLANWQVTGKCELKLPNNLYLWATMNSADQGVFPLDTAFKRRWSFEYIGIDDGESQAPDLNIQIKNQTYDWKPLRKFLNRLLVLNGVNEDKLMGPFFLKDATEFDSKVLMYLWEDAARMCRRAVFGEIKTYSELCDKWEEKGIKIFDDVAKFVDTDLTRFLSRDNPPPAEGEALPQQHAEGTDEVPQVPPSENTTTANT